MADYDLPAVFKYVNNITKQKMHYIGHSQGTIQMHIALAKRNPVVE
jgi:gastric triacylglycerol lipase